MDGSDDYFDDDDIILDDDTLALLEKEEKKLGTPVVEQLESARQHSTPNGLVRPTNLYPLPSAKRQKIAGGWRPTEPSRQASLNGVSDLPEISLGADGSYAVPNTRRDVQAAPPNPPSRPAPPNRTAPVQNPLIAGPSSSTRPSAPPRPQSRPLRPPRPPDPPATRATSIPPGHGSNQQSELDALKAEVEKLKRDKVAAEESLKKANDAMYASAGEARILRMNIQKMTQETAAEIQKQKAAREAAESRLHERERDLKEEFERQKVQFTFRQHELQMSVRQSARVKKRVFEPPPTPLTMPPQMQGWNRRTAGPSQTVQKTPRRSSPSKRPVESPIANRTQRQPQSPEKPKQFRGFENAFAPTTPVRSPTAARSAKDAKGKGRAVEDDPFSPRKSQAAALPARSQSGIHDSKRSSSPSPMDLDIPDLAGGGSPTKSQFSPAQSRIRDDSSAFADDVDMGDDDERSPGSEDNDEYPPPDWVHELRKILFTHAGGPEGTLTMQALMAAPVSLESEPRLRADLIQACSNIMELLGTSVTDEGLEALFPAVAGCLIRVSDILARSKLLPILIGTLSLVFMLVISLPSYATAVLATTSPPDSSGQSSRMLEVLNFVIRMYLVPLNNDDSHPVAEPERTKLATETLRLTESLAWHASDEVVEELGCFPTAPKVLANLLHPKQPLWILERTARILVLLAGRPAIFRQLLAFSEGYTGPNANDYTKLPHFERLCAFLADSAPGSEGDEFRMSILSFIGGLSRAHPDAHTMILEVQTVIPAIVLFLGNLSIPIFEDSARLRLEEESVQTRAIMKLHQTLYLLHYLILSRETLYNLPAKLNTPPYVEFSGALHIILVALGRIMYADPPGWVTQEQRRSFDEMRELARDLMDLLSEGPEWEDEVAAVFTWEEEDKDQERGVTEEEEAMLMDADDTNDDI